MQRKETRHACLHWLSATGRLYDSQCRKLFGSPSRRVPFLFLLKIPSSCSRAIIILTLFTLVYVILSRCWHFFLQNNSATVSCRPTVLLTINLSSGSDILVPSLLHNLLCWGVVTAPPVMSSCRRCDRMVLHRQLWPPKTSEDVIDTDFWRYLN
jgi:hypothetical protein